MRVKICGIMRQKDVEMAAKCGADALGFVVETPQSQRNLTLDKARRLIKKVHVFTSTVAVTTSTDRKTLLRIASKLRPDALQIYCPNSNTISKFDEINPELSIILATPLTDYESFSNAQAISEYSDAILVDSPTKFGVNKIGRPHDWNLTAQLRRRIHPHPLIIAGGLTPSNVRHAIKKVRPYAVDVSSGIEKRVGVKDPCKMKKFIENAKEET